MLTQLKREGDIAEQLTPPKYIYIDPLLTLFAAIYGFFRMGIILAVLIIFLYIYLHWLSFFFCLVFSLFIYVLSLFLIHLLCYITFFNQ
jgi:hypothetical protein